MILDVLREFFIAFSALTVLLPWKIVRWCFERLWDFRYANDPVLFVYPKCGVLYGRIKRRAGAEIVIELDHARYQPFGHEALPIHAITASLIFGMLHGRLIDEDITWCRGHEGENADAFRALVTMA